MKRTYVNFILLALVALMCISVFIACDHEKQQEQQTVSIVITDVKRDTEVGVLYVSGYSVSDKQEFRFKFKDEIESGEEPLVSNVVEITYNIKNENEDAITIESMNVLSKEVFSGRVVFIKGRGACFISSANDVYELNQIQGLNAEYYNHLKLADSVIVYGDITSLDKSPIVIRASHLEVSKDNEVRAWNEAELAILEKYDVVDSYDQTQYETPLGDRDPSDPEISELLALTDAKVKEEYGIDDLDNYSVRISEHASKPQKTVEYNLFLLGYYAHESYSITIDNNGNILNCYSSADRSYSRFLPYITLEKLQEAEEKLKNKMSEYSNSSYFYLSINTEGQLCLSAEAIVYIDPPNDGIDHEHIFESEVVCDIVP